ncbi:hypothetical protein AKJ48_01800 [candidate division MSBL1 archaeon SCGC-AAA261O19]|uniref:ORC1/DEAH AAA+ ATPase domain-containing protein n=2 Tax=candidate division MSBL1 TaxID=215777 RepID=A0A133UZX9_9EURY|nr:hypothetical protein AKJ42_02570 [candidate division MSBL1 archaeon SCGC-AAA261C02]KXB04668.1 hypothetical protein AKJ48_01800 [candidate division MSBL1 archaeon SCGC-AAA261O19]
MPTLLEEKFRTNKFERKKRAFFKRFDWDFMPFSQKEPLPDPKLLVPHQIEEVRKSLDMVQEGDLVLFVVSEIGMGKTTLCKFLAETLPQEEDHDSVSVFLHGPSIEAPEQMARLILERLELQAREGDLASEFEQLRRWHENYPDLTLILIVDEFPDVDKSALELVREIADLEGIVWVLNGQEDQLIELVEDNAPALLDRRRYTLRLEPMSLEKVKELLTYRMAWVEEGDYNNRSIEPFTEEAIKEIHERAEGIPREALKLAGDAVYNAIKADAVIITKELVHEREEEKKSFWSFLPFFKSS